MNFYNKKTGLVLLLLLVIIGFFFFQSGNARTPAGTVHISITGPQDTGLILENTAVNIAEGDTVLQVLTGVTKENRIQMEYSGIKSTAYVEGIANIYEFDRGAESGWMYSVNDIFPNKSAGVYTLQNGDVIKWLYTVDLGREFGVDFANMGEGK